MLLVNQNVMNTRKDVMMSLGNNQLVVIMDDVFKIIMVEDDLGLCEVIAPFLISHHFDVTVVHTLAELNTLLAQSQPDLIILDLHLPDGSGLDACRTIKSQTHPPAVLMLTGSQEEIDKILALEIGADNYLTKPATTPRSLLAYVKAMLRARSQIGTSIQTTDSRLEFDTYTIDEVRRVVTTKSGTLIDLSGNEYALLLFFAKHPRVVFSRNQLLEGMGSAQGMLERSIDTLISRLRKKLESNPSVPKFLKTMREGGYLFDAEVRIKSSGKAS